MATFIKIAKGRWVSVEQIKQVYVSNMPDALMVDMGDPDTGPETVAAEYRANVAAQLTGGE